MWELAHEQGIKLPYRDYWEFASATSVGGGTDGLDGLDRIYHLTELIQSSPETGWKLLQKIADLLEEERARSRSLAPASQS